MRDLHSFLGELAGENCSQTGIISAPRWLTARSPSKERLFVAKSKKLCSLRAWGDNERQGLPARARRRARNGGSRGRDHADTRRTAAGGVLSGGAAGASAPTPGGCRAGGGRRMAGAAGAGTLRSDACEDGAPGLPRRPSARARGGASRPAAGVSPCRRAAGAPQAGARRTAGAASGVMPTRSERRRWGGVLSGGSRRRERQRSVPACRGRCGGPASRATWALRGRCPVSTGHSPSNMV